SASNLPVSQQHAISQRASTQISPSGSAVLSLGRQGAKEPTVSWDPRCAFIDTRSEDATLRALVKILSLLERCLLELSKGSRAWGCLQQSSILWPTNRRRPERLLMRQSMSELFVKFISGPSRLLSRR